MDTEKLRILEAAAAAQSLSAAGEQLGYTTSGISRAIASLEEEMGFPLFIRGRRGVTMTAECRRILPEVRKVLHAEELLLQEAGAIRGLESGTLSIGCAYGGYYRKYLSETVQNFTARHPEIQIELFQGTSSELMKQLKEGRGDLCLVSWREGDFRWIPLAQEPLKAVVPAGHPLAGHAQTGHSLAGRSQGDRAQVGAYPIARFAEDAYIDLYPEEETDNSRMLQREGIRPRTRYACTDVLAALGMVEAGMGVVLVNEGYLEHWQGQTAALPLDPPQLVEIGLAVPADRAASPVLRQFLSESGL
ncbi:MAG: LysR family transcriptional regulator [Lachnospiraceae bacterium]|nr:LysR family transcriptional regulator [Lachnospiraceae bacterium]